MARTNRSSSAAWTQTAHGAAWTFYEGPPTANGMPGTHHVEARVFKDVFPRFKTMKGYHVPRMAGWDCHGLPVELAVEKELGFTGKPDIEAYGIAEFNAKCRENVQRHVDAFEAMSERMGYWADYENAYWTMNARLRRVGVVGAQDDLRQGPAGRGLPGRAVLPALRHRAVRPRGGAGLREVVDPSVYVRFPLTSGPWAGRRRPGRLDDDAVDARVEHRGRGAPRRRLRRRAHRRPETFVVAEPLLSAVLGEDAQVLRRFSGRDLEGWNYSDRSTSSPSRAAHFVVLADYVTTEDGTGLVHQAPAFGADDLAVARHTASRWSTRSAATADSAAISRTSAGCSSRTPTRSSSPSSPESGRLLRHVPYAHTYPHCWRCHTPLMYYALPSWYVRTTAIKDELLAENEATNWYPPTIKHGRYGDWLTNNIDWALSRDRYWGTPLPVWRNDADPSRVVCVGSLAELSELVGRDLADRPAPAVRRRRDVHRARRGGHLPASSAGDRRLVRLRLDAVRAVRRAVPQRGALRARATRPTSSARRSTRPAAGSTR